jgi:drug/metabolite transporter (DMT)-like permease
LGYLYCVLALVSWTVLAFAYRLGERLGSNRFYMVAGMGLSALVLDLMLVVARGMDLSQAHLSQFLVGVGAGACVTANIPCLMAAMRRGDLSITWTVLTLAFGPAALLGIFYPGEHPTAGALSGLVLSAAAVVLLGMDAARRHRGQDATAGQGQGAGGGEGQVASAPPGRRKKGWAFFMAISFATNIVGLYAFTLAKHLAPDARLHQNLAFLVSLHAVFGCLGLLLALVARAGGSARGGLTAGALGGSMIFTGGLFTTLAFSSAVPGYVVFPTTNGGSNVLVVALSVILLRERPGRLGWVGILAGVAALVLLGTMA